MTFEKYALELKRLKLFSEKWQAYFQNAQTVEKQELINLLSDLLKNSDSVDFVLQAKQKTDEIFKVIGEPLETKLSEENCFDDDGGFNLDDAVNPKNELNLEDLCKELGVFEG